MKYKHVIFFAAGVALFLLVINNFGLYETAAALAAANMSLIAAAIALQLLFLGLFVLRLKVLVRGRGYISFWQASRIAILGMFISMVTPIAKLGGEPLKIYMLRPNLGDHNASAAVALESILELISSVVMVFVIALLLFWAIPASLAASFIAFLVVLSVAIAIILKLIFTPRWLNKIVGWISVRFAKAVDARKKDYVVMFSNTFYDMVRRKRTISAAFLISMAMKLVEMARLWIIFLALGVFVPFHVAVIIWAIIMVIMFIPWLPGSLGLAEFGTISAMLAFGVAAPAAASITVLDRLVSFWLPLTLGIWAFAAARKRGELPNLLKRKQPYRQKDIHHFTKNTRPVYGKK